MRILYGVQSTGNGHITRARAMARALADQGLSVDYLFSGREADQFFDMEGFGAYRLCQGFTLAIENGRLDTLGTLRRLAPRRFLREVRALDLEPYDLVITDFEPVTAWAARLRHKPSVGIGHQYAFLYPVPRPAGGAATTSPRLPAPPAPPAPRPGSAPTASSSATPASSRETFISCSQESFWLLSAAIRTAWRTTAG